MGKKRLYDEMIIEMRKLEEDITDLANYVEALENSYRSAKEEKQIGKKNKLGRNFTTLKTRLSVHCGLAKAMA